MKINEVYIGGRYGKLTVLEKADPIRDRKTWLCKCDCGIVKVIRDIYIKRGTESCGCKWKEAIVESNTKHKLIHTRIYRAWTQMKGRCTRKNQLDYQRYGGRGITFCDEWKDFKNFYEWAIRSGYDDKLSLDRIDNNGNYGPNNCRWATAIEQSNNRRTNRLITIDGETKTLAEWSRYSGKNYYTIKSRLGKGVTGRALIV